MTSLCGRYKTQNNREITGSHSQPAVGQGAKPQALCLACLVLNPAPGTLEKGSSSSTVDHRALLFVKIIFTVNYHTSLALSFS